MPVQYPTKPQRAFENADRFLVKVDPSVVKDAHDALWLAFFQGYADLPADADVDFVRGTFRWFGWTKELRKRFDKACRQDPDASERQNLVVALHELGFDGNYLWYENEPLRQISAFIHKMDWMHRRLGRGLWATEELSTLLDVRYVAALKHVGGFINRAELSEIIALD